MNLKQIKYWDMIQETLTIAGVTVRRAGVWSRCKSNVAFGEPMLVPVMSCTRTQKIPKVYKLWWFKPIDRDFYKPLQMILYYTMYGECQKLAMSHADSNTIRTVADGA